MSIRCWWCGIEPADTADVIVYGEATPRQIHNWPPGNHRHAAVPPTPQQLVEDGHRILRRILEDA